MKFVPERFSLKLVAIGGMLKDSPGPVEPTKLVRVVECRTVIQCIAGLRSVVCSSAAANRSGH